MLGLRPAADRQRSDWLPRAGSHVTLHAAYYVRRVPRADTPCLALVRLASLRFARGSVPSSDRHSFGANVWIRRKLKYNEDLIASFTTARERARERLD